jgi:hypothetical protein|tara:strand:+ start:1673 stop:2026 length:354 start_codon:yes stop_codon:yes gene_type:complete
LTLIGSTCSVFNSFILEFKNKLINTRILILVLTLLVSACATEPPVQMMSDARQAIAAAEEADAPRLAPVPIAEARRYIALAETQIRNGSFTYAWQNAQRAKNRAVEALNAARTEDQN